MRRTFKILLQAAAIFALAALAAHPLKPRFGRLGAGSEGLAAPAGGGVLFAVLGGYRSLAADFIWIKSYVNWERKDIAKCVSAMELACGIDPQMTMFWTQGASVIAFDIPHWLYGRLPPQLRTDAKLEALKARQARQAMRFIDKGAAMNPDNYAILVQKGQIAIAAGMFKIAEECFGRAAKLNDGFYARRIYASLLAKNGKFAESAKVLRAILGEAEPDNPARADIATQLRAVEKLVEKTK